MTQIIKSYYEDTNVIGDNYIPREDFAKHWADAIRNGRGKQRQAVRKDSFQFTDLYNQK